MKTALEIFNKYGAHYDLNDEDKVINAMKEYAKQAIDRCAESAELDEMLQSEGIVGIRISSILDVKSELK